MTTTRLEPLRWWQLDEVMVLEQELFGREQWSPETFWSELARAVGGVHEQTRRYWAAVGEAGEVLGYAGLAVAGDEGYVQTLGVAGRARRRGLGAALLRQLLSDAEHAGCRSCWLEVRADNDAAQALYTHHGFGARGRRKGYYQPSGTDAIVMARPIASGARGGAS